MGSDKVYRVSMHRTDGGFLVNGANGKRGSTLKTRPQTDSPVCLEKAEALYAKLVNEKKHHRDTPYVEGPDMGDYDPSPTDPGGTAAVAVDAIVTEAIAPQLLTSVEDHEEAARLIGDDGMAVQKKHDGKRIVLVAERSGIFPYNRTKSVCGVAPNLIEEAKKLREKIGNFIFDGESVGAHWIVTGKQRLIGKMEVVNLISLLKSIMKSGWW